MKPSGLSVTPRSLRALGYLPYRLDPTGPLLMVTGSRAICKLVWNCQDSTYSLVYPPSHYQVRPVLYQAKKTPPSSPFACFPVSNFYSPLFLDDTVFPWEPGFTPLTLDEWCSYPYVPTTRERRVDLRLAKQIAIEASNRRFWKILFSDLRPFHSFFSSDNVPVTKKTKTNKNIFSFSLFSLLSAFL
jgi:hypothetical protein